MNDIITVTVNASTQKVTWFEELGERLVLRPSFQRRAVWSLEQRSFLIDTILRDLPVPEIYVYSEPSSEGQDQYYLIDGQQRLRACIEFMNDAYSVNFDLARLTPPFNGGDIPWLNKRFSELDPELKKKFRQYQFVMREVVNASSEQIRHIFYRLNQSSYALNSQELRYSMYEGGLLEVAERLTKREEWQHFRLFTLNQRRRMLDTEFISELIIGYLHWPQNKKDNIDHYYRQYGFSFPFADSVIDRFVQVLELLALTFPEPRMARTRWYKKSDFYTLFIALAKNRIIVENPTALRRTLIDFANEVDTSFLVGGDSPVEVYRDAVERAATDRARRVRREEALVAFFQGRETVDVYIEEDEDYDELTSLGDAIEEDLEEAEVYEDADEPVA